VGGVGRARAKEQEQKLRIQVVSRDMILLYGVSGAMDGVSKRVMDDFKASP